MTLVDSNILIDIFTDDPDWADWSANALITSGAEGTVGINPIVYAEISVAFEVEEQFEKALQKLGLSLWELPYPAGFLAGKAFLSYRSKGGERRSPLPDFYIGAHAVTSELNLLTRDYQRYRTYFPTAKLIHP